MTVASATSATPKHDTTEVLTREAHAREVARGERFEFGKNWAAFLEVLDEGRILDAEHSICTMLRTRSLEGKRVLDIGSGSGLFSLAARRLGATVHSFDYDTDSVACGRELRRRFDTDPSRWTIEQGSVLDELYMRSLGTYDVVYSWGVLHHTGRMWDAIAAASRAVAPGGQFFIAIYNDLGSRSLRWRRLKQVYNRLPRPLRPAYALAVSLPDEGKAFARALLHGRPEEFRARWRQPNARGMQHWRDIVDWVGGYPYEVAAPEDIFEFCRERGLALTNLRCRGVGLGCNEFVFERSW